MWESDVARQFKIRSLPHMILYSPRGAKVGEGWDEVGRVVIEDGSRLQLARENLAQDREGVTKLLGEIHRGSPGAEEAKRILSGKPFRPPGNAGGEDEPAESPEDRAKRLLDEARAALEEKDDAVAFDRLTRAVALGETSSAEEAKRLLAEFEADPERVKAIRDAQGGEEARRALTMATNYAANGKVEKAIALLQGIVEKYPGSTWAEKAQQQIDALSAPPEKKEGGG